MKFFHRKSTLKFDWETVSSAWHRRYPNPFSKHVLSEDVVSRCLENDVLKSKRLLVKTNPAPKWTTKFVGSGVKSACIIEESLVDPKRKVMTTYSRNIFFTSLMVVEEKCVYSVCPNNKNWTECRKDAWISSNVFGLARAIESFGIERYKKNIVKARKGLEYITERLFTPDRLPYTMKNPNIGSP
ncbi:PRELI domain-containing protein 1, mitochondrial-like [Dendronephthya gigantea]|uniref:PRELI domain-containing protein 1, mitochondrial-like n=1 Tax=Dendronephthya gigantea TaxID=151771 RepID=UPI00106BE8CF|nr:PRELI domain-containing protein 1, mitochondrial-like [Dendronephthya gigantea]